MGNFTKGVMRSRDFAEDWLSSAEREMQHVVDVLTKAERMGENSDSPEGARYIHISDTMANKMSNRLNKILSARNY